jgi:hypothetical protein
MPLCQPAGLDARARLVIVGRRGRESSLSSGVGGVRGPRIPMGRSKGAMTLGRRVWGREGPRLRPEGLDAREDETEPGVSTGGGSL